MATLTATQRAWRGRIEAVLRLAAPALDLYLAAGDRLSRAVERDDLDWVPPRTALNTTTGSSDSDRHRDPDTPGQ